MKPNGVAEKYLNNIHSKKVKIVLPIFIVILLSLILSVFYVKFIRNVTYDNVYQNITELSEQTATQLNLSITNQIKFVGMMVDFINGGYANTVDQVFERFTPDLESYHFTRLVILDEKGNGVTSDGYTVKDYPNISEFFQANDVHLSENRPSTVSDNQVNIYSKTFTFNGKKMVLFATINTENYKEILSRRLFNGKGETYLISSNGSVLIDSSGKISDTRTNLYEYLKENNHITKEKEQQKITQMAQGIENLQTKTFHILLDGETNFIHYEKLGVNNWYVVTIAPGSTIAKELNLFLIISLGLCSIINLIVIGVFIYIYFSNQKKNQKIYEIAYIDPITSLGNENYFKENAAKFLLLPAKNKYVMILDINKFRALNKMYDYELCNQILQMFGTTIENTLPKENITTRMNRDIFAAVFIYNGNIEKLANKIFEEVSKLKDKVENLNIHTSIGIYKITPEDNDINKILDKVYMAHSKTKGLYGNNYFIFDESLENKFIEEQKIEVEMERALKNNEFYVVYQPKVYTKNEQLAGAESLVRWSKNDQLFPPSKFIPLFEKNKFIIKLDLYVFEAVCKDLAEWNQKYHTQPVVSVNVSKEHFVDENFIDQYVEIADKYKVDKTKIDLEITESATIDDTIDIVRVLKKIKKKGFIISIDDFGTGYSSLNMLQNMPIDIIKIDKSFVDHIDLKGNKNIIDYIVFISKKLGVKTIVEGVETKEQVEYMRNLKCDIIQGYYYSKPILKEEFETYFNQNQ